MPPFGYTLIPRSLGQVSSELRNQWTNPGDVFSVLLILGGDVVARALAQSTGWVVGPPSFSFGWVAYSINALVAAVGDNKLLPEPDYACIVISGKSGYARDNKSWILGRMVRDYDFWMDKDIRSEVNRIVDAKWTDSKNDAKSKKLPEPKRPSQAGLCVSIYHPDESGKVGQPRDQRLWIQSFTIAILQLGIAAIPCGLYDDWSVLVIAACGILLSVVTASKEKPFVLTRGNGSQDAIVVLGHEGFLDLEDLAAGQTDVDIATSWSTRAAVGVLALLWILLLITASGIKHNTWFLLAVGGIGILFNIYVAGKQKDPSSNGIPVKFVEVLGEPKGMDALIKLEKAYPGVGSSMRDTFFPGKLRTAEEKIWSDLEGDVESRRKTAQSKSSGKAPVTTNITATSV